MPDSLAVCHSAKYECIYIEEERLRSQNTFIRNRIILNLPPRIQCKCKVEGMGTEVDQGAKDV